MKTKIFTLLILASSVMVQGQGHTCDASFGFSLSAGFKYLFYANGTSGSQNFYHWNFGDGSTLDTTYKYIFHTFTGNGSYNVCLTAYNINPTTHDTLCSDTVCHLVIVGPNCVATIGYYQVNGLQYHFYQNATTGDQNFYHWDFGDSTTTDTSNKNAMMNHYFPRYGVYNVCLTVYKIDSGTHDTLCSNRTCQYVHVNANCVANFSGYQMGLRYHFNVNSSPGTQNFYHWDFGDSTTLDTNYRYPWHTFPQYGTYNVCMIAYNIDTSTHDTLCSDTLCKNITLTHICVANFSFYQYNGFAYHLYENATTGEQNFYHWEFGDGTHKDTTASHAMITHTYPANGLYFTCLYVYHIDTLTHDTLCSDTLCKNVIIGPYCKAAFNSYKLNDSTYRFYENAGMGTQNHYHWDFGDGTSLDTTGRYISHIFPGDGRYNVCLTVYQINPTSHDTMCSDTVCHDVIIGHYCEAHFSFYQYHGLRYHFYENSTSGQQNFYHWDFGDSTTLDTINRYPFHTFPASGTFIVCLTSWAIDTVHWDTLCHATYCDTVIVSTSGMIEAGINKNSLVIYPNPANSEITLQYPGNRNIVVEFISVEGKQMLRVKMDQPSTTLDISTWPTGIYLVKILSKDEILIRRFVKE